MTEFEKDLAHSKKIEQHFKTHPKFPFLTLGTLPDENVLDSLFWLYMVKPYTNHLVNEQWDRLSGYYQSFRIPEDWNNSGISFYGIKSKILFGIDSVNYHDDKFGYNHFTIAAGTEDILAAATEDEQNMLYSLGIGVDLRHPEALDKAREFMHAFFIEKLPLEEMEKKIEDFDKFEGYKFKRDSDYAKKAIEKYEHARQTGVHMHIQRSTARFGDLCPATGMWYCKDVTTEQGIYLRKGDFMPGQSYNAEQRESMLWRLVKPMDES